MQAANVVECGTEVGRSVGESAVEVEQDGFNSSLHELIAAAGEEVIYIRVFIQRVSFV